jgi:hypothetical protein
MVIRWESEYPRREGGIDVENVSLLGGVAGPVGEGEPPAATIPSPFAGAAGH